MKMRKIALNLTLLVFGLASLALAAAQVTMDTIAEKQETVVVDGVEQSSYVPADVTVPGDILRFTLLYANAGDTTASGVVLNNPIPQGTVYLTDSAIDTVETQALFSIDGGVTYASPKELTHSVTLPNGRIEQQVAPAEKYTHVRWIIGDIAAGASGQVSYKALIL